MVQCRMCWVCGVRALPVTGAASSSLRWGLWGLCQTIALQGEVFQLKLGVGFVIPGDFLWVWKVIWLCQSPGLEEAEAVTGVIK